MKTFLKAKIYVKGYIIFKDVICENTIKMGGGSGAVAFLNATEVVVRLKQKLQL